VRQGPTVVASRMSLHHRGEGSPNLKGILPATRDAVYCPKDDNVRCRGVLPDHPVVTPAKLPHVWHVSCRLDRTRRRAGCGRLRASCRHSRAD
jgi:hypothetical protein